MFDTLEPPSGGVLALQRRIARERRRQTRTRRITASAALLVTVAIAIGTLQAPGAPQPHGPRLDLGLARMQLGLSQPPGETVTIPAEDRATVAALEQPVADDRVVFYLVASRGTPESP